MVAEAHLLLDQCIRSFRSLQNTLMPFAASSDVHTGQPETELLHLPSSFPQCKSLTPSMFALPRLQAIEAKLCFARGKEMLDDLRQQRLVQVYYQKYTRSNVCGQHGNTRSQSLLKQTSAKIQVIAW
jgi:hypothetical protein